MLKSRPLWVALALMSATPSCVNEPGHVWVDDDPPDDDPPHTPEAGMNVPDAGRDASRDATPIFVPDTGLFPFPGARDAAAPPKRLAMIEADEPPPAISGGTLAVTDDGAIAVAADPDRDLVYVVDVQRNAVETATMAKGSEPGRVVLDGAGYAHVILRNSAKVARIALANATVELTTEVCEHPRGIAHDPSADAVLVACGNGELVALAARTHAQLSRAFIALDLRDVIVTKTSQRYVTRYRSAELIAIDRDGRPTSTSHPNTLPGFTQNGSVTLSPTLAWRTTVGSDGNVVMLHQSAQNEAVVVREGGYGGGCATITRPSVTRYDEQGKPALTAGLIATALAVDVAISPDGQTIAVASPGAYLRGLGTVGLMKLPLVEEAGAPGVLADAGASTDAPLPFPTDAGFPGIVDAGFPGSPCTNITDIGYSDGQATAVAFDRSGLVYVFSREPAELRTFRVDHFLLPQPQATIRLHARSVRDTGHELFHADVGSGLSCASCHGEARDDGHVWTFQGFGPRRTQTMRGGILSTLPLHWQGDMPTFKHLVDEVMTGRMGGFKVEEPYANALANWIDAQPELLLSGRDASAIARGKALFESPEVKCATCHSGPQLTNNLSVDVGTGEALQVPTLLGLALRGPYMHNGCAKTLRERFDPSCGGGDRHGRTSQLSAAQIADLVTYLESL